MQSLIQQKEWKLERQIREILTSFFAYGSSTHFSVLIFLGIQDLLSGERRQMNLSLSELKYKRLLTITGTDSGFSHEEATVEESP